MDQKAKIEALKTAAEIAKESARSGNASPEIIMERAYKKFVDILTEIEKN